MNKRTIIFTIFLLIALYLLQQLTGVILILFISFLIMTAISPIVTTLEKWKVPRQLSALVFLLLILSAFASGIAALIPPLVDQTGAFLSRLPSLLSQLGIHLDQTLISNQLGSIPQDALKVLSAAFSNVIAVFTILVISFYLTVQKREIFKYIPTLFNEKKDEVAELLERIEVGLGSWIRGQIMLCVIIGIAAYVGLLSLSISYAIPLAIIAGILEAVPNIGPTISMFPAMIVGFTISPLHGGAVILLYFLIQQLENNLIVPFVMKKTVGLHPIVTIVSLMAGLQLGGPLGAVLAIPLVIVGRVIVPFLYKNRNTV